uniref:Secreted protein n=1 Tax=Solanum tuberosum TaxID=4113 RepID=M1CTB9_SOLTU
MVSMCLFHLSSLMYCLPCLYSDRELNFSLLFHSFSVELYPGGCNGFLRGIDRGAMSCVTWDSCIQLLCNQTTLGSYLRVAL